MLFKISHYQLIFYTAKNSQRLMNSIVLLDLLLSLTSVSEEMLPLCYCYDHTLLKDKYLLLYSW